MNNLYNLISTLGFPIAIAGMLIYAGYRLLFIYSKHILTQSDRYLKALDTSLDNYKQGDRVLYEQILSLKTQLNSLQSLVASMDKKLLIIGTISRDTQRFLEKTTDFSVTKIEDN